VGESLEEEWRLLYYLDLARRVVREVELVVGELERRVMCYEAEVAGV